MLSGLSVIEILGLFFVHTLIKQIKKWLAEKFINKKTLNCKGYHT